MNQTELKAWLKANVDWDRFFSLVNSVGDELNSRKLRFDKSDLFEQSLERFSNSKMVWVDKEGWDHELPDGSKIEMKFQKDSLRTKEKRKRKGKVAEIRLKNTMSDDPNRTLKHTFDHLLICDNDAVAVIEFSKLNSFTKVKGDVIVTNALPCEELDFVITPSEINRVPTKALSYKEAKQEMQITFLREF